MATIWIMNCNTDAAIFKDMRTIGGATVIKDHNGEFMVCRIFKHQSLLKVREAETKALLEALTWAISMDLQHVIFETDSKFVVDAIHSNPRLQRIWIDNCTILLTHLNKNSLQSSICKRQVNVVALTLARATKSYASPCVCYDPDFLSDYLLHDCIDS